MVSAPATAPGSLSEGAAERSEAEGVSSDGSTGPMVYPPAIINSVIFERLRSSKYTPSVSHSLDSSLREGAGGGLAPFNRVLANIRGYGRFSSPLRNSEIFTFHHSSGYTPSVSPSGCQLPQRGSRDGAVPFNRVLAEIRGCGRCGEWHPAGRWRSRLPL